MKAYKMVLLPENYCEVSCFFLGKASCEKPLN